MSCWKMKNSFKLHKVFHYGFITKILSYLLGKKTVLFKWNHVDDT